MTFLDQDPAAGVAQPWTWADRTRESDLEDSPSAAKRKERIHDLSFPSAEMNSH